MPTHDLAMSSIQLHAAEFARMMGEWAPGTGPLYRELAMKLQALIEEGALPPDSLLPPERPLAEALVVSRTTVSAAYEALRKRRLVESRRGSGTRVRARDAHHHLVDRTKSFPWPNLLRSSPAEQEARRDEVINLCATDMEASPALTDVLANMTRRDWGLATARDGYVPAGLPELRAAVARDLTARGVPTSTDQLLITTGAQQAYQLVVATFLKPGAGLIVEDPTYAGALTIFEDTHAQMLPVPLDHQGIDVNQARRWVETKRAALIHVTPTYHNPTGAVMSAQRRQDLVRLADEYKIPIVESLALHDIALSDAVTPPPIASINQRPVISIGSFSSLFWAGLRIGWLRAPKQLLGDLKRLKAKVDLGTPVIDQFIAVRLMPKIAAVKEQRCAEIRRRCLHLKDSLSQAIPDWSWSDPAGGASLWVQLPFGSATQFAQVAARHGVAILPGPAFSPSGTFDDRIRLSFVLDEETLSLGVERLARAWRDYVGAARGRRDRLAAGERTDRSYGATIGGRD